MKIKRIISATLIGSFIIFSYLYFSNTTKIYMGIVDSSSINGIDITVNINNRYSFEDTLFNGLFNYKVKTVKMRWGKNELTVTSSKTQTVLKREIFLYPFENIVIDFYPSEKSIRQPASFTVGVIRGNFVYE